MKNLKLCALLALSLVTTLSSASICNNTSIKGNYSAIYQEGEFTGFGSFSFDGTTDTSGYGKVTFSGFENGKLASSAMVTGTTGKYIFNSSCNLSLSITWHPYPFPNTVFIASMIAVGNQMTNPANTAATATTPIVYGIRVPASMDGAITGRWDETVGTSVLSHKMNSTVRLTRQFK